MEPDVEVLGEEVEVSSSTTASIASISAVGGGDGLARDVDDEGSSMGAE